MATILASFGSGGAGLAPNQGTSPDLATILRDIADDLAGVQGQLPGTAISIGALTSSAPAALTSAAPGALTSSQNATANANAQTGAYVQADVQSIATLANALKTSYNALQVDAAALRTNQGLIQADVAALRATLAQAVADLATIRTAANGKGGNAASYTVKTIKG